MEPHGGRTIAEGSSVADPVPEHSGSGGETGLEESMEDLELGGVEESYPQRPGEADCLHYLRTGYCGYGSSCRFNHPHDRGKAIRSARPSGGEYPQRADQPVCQYYMRTGACKYGASCKYHHPRQGATSGSHVSLNYQGYPIRPGEKECPYYMKTGQCKFGDTCKFHHPEPVGMQVPAAPPQPLVSHIPAALHSPYPAMSLSGPSSQDFGAIVRPTLLPGPYVGPYGHVMFPPGIVSFPGFWGPYTGPVPPVAAPGVQLGVGPSSVSGVVQTSFSGVPYYGHYQPVQSSPLPSSSRQREHLFPFRPGQPICQYYKRTGECKFGSSCKYHHPSELIVERTDPAMLRPASLPLRPGATPCAHYMQHGVCRFGPACKFDHPIESMSYSPSTSSLSDMPVAPPVEGSVISTLTPSSSTSELHPKTVAGYSKEPVSTNISSSMSTSSEAASGSGSLTHSKVEKSDSGDSHSSSTDSNNSRKESNTST